MSRFIAFACLFAFPAFAGPTETITGCATVAVEGTNYTTFADPTCPAAAKAGGDGESAIRAFIFDAWAEKPAAK